MTMTPGASLDAAIAGINRGIDNARKVAKEINKSTPAPSSSSQSSSSSKGTTGRIGGNIDVTA